MNTQKRLTHLVVAALAMTSAISTTESRAAVLDYDETVSVNTSRLDGPFTIGNSFTVVTDQMISHLGAQDTNASAPTGVATLGDGFLVSPVDVGIWDAASPGTALATVTVASTDVLIDSYRYAAIAGGPITLVTGKTYLIGAFVGFNHERVLDADFGNIDQADPFSATSNFVLVDDLFNGSTVALAAPLTGGGGTPGRWGAANAAFIPTPAALPAGLVAFGLIAARRSRKE